ncbi:unnamed protein product [Calypogeia fissa]
MKMVTNMETSVTNGVSPQEHNILDSSKLKGGLTSNGERVYRRRIRSLKDLPVQVISHPNYAEGREVGSRSNFTSTSGPSGSGGHDPVLDGSKFRSGQKAERLSSDDRNQRGTSPSKLSLIEVTPDVGQVRGRISKSYRGQATESGAEERRVSQVVTVVPTSKMQSRVPSSDLLGNADRNGKQTRPAKPIGAQRQSTLDMFFRDPKRKAEDGGAKYVASHKAASDVDVNLRGLLKRDRKSPPKYKRKKRVVENMAAPPKSNIFPPVPPDDEVLRQKRQKVRKKGVRNGELPRDASAMGLSSKKRASMVESDRHKDRPDGQPPPAIAKKRRKLPSVPITQVPENSCEEFPRLLSIPVEAVGPSDANVVPVSLSVSVPVGTLGIPQSLQAPISVAVEALPSPHPNLVPVSIPVESLGLPQSTEIRVVIPVESLGIPQINQLHVSVPVKEVRSPRPNLFPGQEERPQGTAMQVKGRTSNLTPKRKLSGIKKDGTPDGRFKKREGLTLVRNNVDTQAEAAKTTEETAPNGEGPAKKLPEVQKNGVRKPKRVQLKRLFVEKTEVQLPSGNGLTNSRVVKSLWSPQKHMKQKAVVGRLEASILQRPGKSTKFLSLQQLDASGKLTKMRARPTSPKMEESEDSASDRTVSDCSTEAKKRAGQTSIGATSQPRKLHESHQNMSLHLKARLARKEQVANQMVVPNQMNVGKKKEKVARRKNSGVPSSSVTTKTKRQQLAVSSKEVKSNGDLRGVPRVLDTTLRRMEQSTSVQQIEETAHGNFAVNAGEKTPLHIGKQPTTAQKTEETEETASGDDPGFSPRTRIQSPSTERISGGFFEGAYGVPRMTPRTRKLTDAMQNFLHQKATLLRQWKEMELGKLHPMALIGRSCKIYWPLDSEWYPGVIHEYNPQSRRHRIDYEDDEREWVNLGKERVKLHVSAEESKTLEMSFGEGSMTDQKKKLDADELAILARGIEGSDGELSHGDLVWAKVKGYPMWPACVMDEEHAVACGLEPSPRERTVPVQFFGSYDHSRINSKKVVMFAKGIMHKFHTKCKRTVFEQGLQEIERYLKECKLPEQMELLEEDVEALVNKKADDMTSSEETEEEDRDIRDESNNALKKAGDSICTFPLELGTLRVLSLGKIVKDSEQFHNETHIWTEGYTAVRMFASMKDAERIIEYKMEVLRNPATPLFPLFRVTPEDDRPVEAPTASGCWKKILIKIQRAKEKAGLCIATLLEKKRQSFRSGPSMFGFGDRRVSRLIQALPNSRVCSKFTAWFEKPSLEEGDDELVPAGYRPVEFRWEHLDRCNVCYLDEEYQDNQLLQCDKCRTMVHMYCYGELEPPDGDLWLCNLCRPEAPKRRPFCCLCPVTGGAMKTTTDGRWCHLTCAMWTPETCLVDVKRMEPVDGITSINKERWKLICTVCKVPYGACLQCSKPRCGVAFHPLCARAAGLSTEVMEDKATSFPDPEGGLQLLTYCKKHRLQSAQGSSVRPQSQQTVTAPQNCPTVSPLLPPPPPFNPSGCARSEPYNVASRRGHRQPEALAAALAKRFFVENKPYFVTGCQRNAPNQDFKAPGGSLWSWHWKPSKSTVFANGEVRSIDEEADCEKTPQSTSERYRHMRSTLHQRLTFGKSSIHGWGVFTKRPHSVGDMVIEYAGEIVRPIIADIRERRSYDSLVGAGTYMFRIDDERVVDATHAGSIAHLINHSCEPNCYSREVTASGDDHIIIFAKRDIQEGEELTYDYRFASKDELLTCYCGCPGCRGFVNTFDTENDPSRIIASRSELTKWVVT